jgi:hypothetical protein
MREQIALLPSESILLLRQGHDGDSRHKSVEPSADKFVPIPGKYRHFATDEQLPSHAYRDEQAAESQLERRCICHHRLQYYPESVTTSVPFDTTLEKLLQINPLSR